MLPVRLEDWFGDTRGLLAEDEHVIHRVVDFCIGARRLRRQIVEVMAGIALLDFGEIVVIVNLDERPVIEAGTLQVLVVRREAERTHEELDARACAEARDISRIARDLWFNQYDMQWFQHLGYGYVKEISFISYSLLIITNPEKNYKT